MGWTVLGSNPGGGARFSAPIRTGPGAHPASYTMGTGSFPGVKQPGRGVDHPPPSSAEVKEKVELYLYYIKDSTSAQQYSFITIKVSNRHVSTHQVVIIRSITERDTES